MREIRFSRTANSIYKYTTNFEYIKIILNIFNKFLSQFHPLFSSSYTALQKPSDYLRAFL